MTLWELQNQWDSEADRKRIRMARAFVRRSARPVIILRDMAISLLLVAIFFAIYIGI